MHISRKIMSNKYLSVSKKLVFFSGTNFENIYDREKFTITKNWSFSQIHIASIAWNFYLNVPSILAQISIQ